MRYVHIQETTHLATKFRINDTLQKHGFNDCIAKVSGIAHTAGSNQVVIRQ